MLDLLKAKFCSKTIKGLTSKLFENVITVFSIKSHKIVHSYYNKYPVRNICSFLYIPCRKNSYSQYKYSNQVECVVNRQIQVEQQAAQDYLSMAVYFLHPCVARPGTGGFFMNMYEEELGHMQDFINYQLTRGGNTIIGCLKAPPAFQAMSIFEAFTKALFMEKCVTQLLEDLVSVAEKGKDYQCADFVTSVFLDEQMKSINEMSQHVTRLARLCHDEHAMYQYDLQLASTHPYKYKRKMPPT